MARLVPRDGAVREVDVRTERGKTRYRAEKGGLMNVDNPKHIAQMKAEGFIEASLMGSSQNTAGLGYTCEKCGFGSWFKECSRCRDNKE